MIEKELRQGVTNVFDFSKSELSDELSFHPIQTISAIDKNLDEVFFNQIEHVDNIPNIVLIFRSIRKI